MNETRTALQRIGGDLFVTDLLLLELPHFEQSTREYILWEFTGWPWWFAPGVGESWVHVLRRQLRACREVWPDEAMR